LTRIAASTIVAKFLASITTADSSLPIEVKRGLSFERGRSIFTGSYFASKLKPMHDATPQCDGSKPGFRKKVVLL
jgi:hypothetical protein